MRIQSNRIDLYAKHFNGQAKQHGPEIMRHFFVATEQVTKLRVIQLASLSLCGVTMYAGVSLHLPPTLARTYGIYIYIHNTYITVNAKIGRFGFQMHQVKFSQVVH